MDFPLASDDVWVDSVFTLETLAQRGIASAPKKIEFSCELDLTWSPSKAVLVPLQYAVILQTRQSLIHRSYQINSWQYKNNRRLTEGKEKHRYSYKIKVM